MSDLVEPQTSTTIVEVHSDSSQTIEITGSTPPVVVEVSGQSPVTGIGTTALAAHVNSTTPHPTYDDLPSLALLFENGII